MVYDVLAIFLVAKEW